jgi:hypothetical protein
MYKNIKIRSRLTEAKKRRYPVETHDTPDAEGHYRGVETIWQSRYLKQPDVTLHYDCFRAPRFVISANGKRMLGTESAAEARSFLRSNFGIRWEDEGFDSLLSSIAN